jgi:tripartite-type tricarboxylate transporter receptor subunit TctC
MVKTTIGAVAFWLASWFASAAIAQDYPTRPVTMVVPFAAGGPIDVLGRMLAPALGEALGQPVVIENTSGGGGMPGAYRVSQAPPDGYQFVLGSIGTHTLSPLSSKKPLYNPVSAAASDALELARLLGLDVSVVLRARALYDGA